jgi:carbon starvation protein CstA
MAMPIPGRWVIWAILVLGVVFVLSGVSNLTTHETSEAAACFGLGALLIGIFAHKMRERREEKEFLTWLQANAQAILAGGGASYRDRTITASTPTRQLTLCVSFLVIGFRLPSRVLIAGVDPMGGRVAAYTLGTLLLGWWSLHGLFWTPGALITNLRGGREGTVGTLLGLPPQS